MKKILLFILALGLLTFGCINGEIRHDIKANGNDNIQVELYKTGVLADADCDSLKENIRTMGTGMSKEDLENLENTPCTETDTSLLLNGIVPFGDASSKVTVVTRSGKEYLRFEDAAGPLETYVVMPSPITSTNGNQIDDNTVKFAPVDVFDFTASNEEIYVECEKPLCAMPFFILGFVGFVALLSRDKI